MSDKLIQPMDSHTFGTSGQFSVLFEPLRDKQRVAAIVLDMIATIASTAAGAVTVYPSQLAAAYSLMFHDSALFHLRHTGRGMRNMLRHLTGKAHQNAGVSVPGAGSATVRFRLPIFLALPGLANPGDGAQEAELLKEGKSLEVNTAASATVGTGGAGVQSISAATVRPYVHYMPEAGDDALPTELHYGFTPWGGQDASLPGGGALVAGHIYDESDDLVTFSEYTHVTLRNDEGEVYVNTPTEELMAQYNERRAMGAAVDAELEQLPVSGSVPFLPYYTAERGAKLGQLIQSEKGFSAAFSGSATSARFSWLLAKYTKPEVAQRAAELRGAAGPVQFVARTLKGTELGGNTKRKLRNAMLLPKRFEPRK